MAMRGEAARYARTTERAAMRDVVYACDEASIRSQRSRRDSSKRMSLNPAPLLICHAPVIAAATRRDVAHATRTARVRAVAAPPASTRHALSSAPNHIDKMMSGVCYAPLRPPLICCSTCAIAVFHAIFFRVC